MRRSTKTLLLVGLMTALFLQPAAGLAAPPEEPPAPDASGAGALAEPGGALCVEPVPGAAEAAAVLVPLEPPQVGQPCCVALCEEICGVGEACACHRCQVIGCGL